VTAQARTLDLASVYAQGSGALVVVSPGMKQALLERLDKYLFPGDKASLPLPCCAPAMLCRAVLCHAMLLGRTDMANLLQRFVSLPCVLGGATLHACRSILLNTGASLAPSNCCRSGPRPPLCPPCPCRRFN
jgi:hypothetical protein